tara:strand:+ start:170 stop:271 length:102 start_codon:yes stop_codon:yes gene_type:complete
LLRRNVVHPLHFSLLREDFGLELGRKGRQELGV